MKGRSTVPPTSDREQPAGERRTEAEQEYIPEQPVEREGSTDPEQVDQDGRHRYRPEY